MLTADRLVAVGERFEVAVPPPPDFMPPEINDYLHQVRQSRAVHEGREAKQAITVARSLVDASYDDLYAELPASIQADYGNPASTEAEFDVKPTFQLGISYTVLASQRSRGIRPFTKPEFGNMAHQQVLLQLLFEAALYARIAKATGLKYHAPIRNVSRASPDKFIETVGSEEYANHSLIWTPSTAGGWLDLVLDRGAYET